MSSFTLLGALDDRMRCQLQPVSQAGKFPLDGVGSDSYSDRVVCDP